MKKKESAGIVIVRYDNDEPMVLLMRAYNYWDFPKGGIEDRETKYEAALREVKEESGITDLQFPWGKTYYETEPYGRERKVVYYFLAETNSSEVVIGENPESGKMEHEEYRWVTFSEAREMCVERIHRVLDWADNRISKIYA